MIIHGINVWSLYDICNQYCLNKETVRSWFKSRRVSYPPFPKPCLYFNRKPYFKVTEIQAWFKEKEKTDNLVPGRQLSKEMFLCETTFVTQCYRHGYILPFDYKYYRNKGYGKEYFFDRAEVNLWWSQFDYKPFVRLNYFLKKIGLAGMQGRKASEYSEYLRERCRHWQIREGASFWFVKDDVDKILAEA